MQLQWAQSYQDTIPGVCVDNSREDDVLDGVEDDAAVRLGRGLAVQTSAWKKEMALVKRHGSLRLSLNTT